MKTIFPEKFIAIFIKSLLLICLWGYSTSAQKLTFAGNEYLKTSKIRALILLPEQIQDSSSRFIYRWKKNIVDELIFEYEKYGFFDVSVEVFMPGENTHPADGQSIYFHIDEGKRYKFGRVLLNCIDGSTPLLGLKELRTAKGKFFTSLLPELDRRKIRKVYGEAGYAKRRVRHHMMLVDTSYEVNVEFEIDPSYLVIFDTLIIENKREKSKEFKPGLSDVNLIRSFLRIEKGERVKLDETALFKSKLKSTQIFNYVRLRDSLLTEKNNTSALILELEEKVPGRVNTSAFWESQDGFGVEAGVFRKNLLGQFYEGRSIVRLAQRRQRLFFGFANPLLFGHRLRLDNDLDLTWRQETGLNDTEDTFEALLSSSLIRPFWKAKYISRLEFESTPEKTILEESITRNQVVKLNWINSLKLTFLDNEFNPTLGTRFLLNWGNGGTVVDAENKFAISRTRHNWYELKTGYYLTFPAFITWAFRLDGGFFDQSGGANSRRFFLGGRNSIRNSDLREICPDLVNVEVDGELLTDCNPDVTPIYYLTSIEMRTALFKYLYLNPKSSLSFLKKMQFVPFWDYGRVWDRGSSKKPEGRGMDVGLGIRFPIIVFNIRLDYAVGWKDGPEWDEWRIQFDLAQAF